MRSSSDKVTKSGHRRNRRPGNKITSLQGLEDALPEVEDKLEAGKVRHRSLKSRPGAIKRKEKVVRGEMDRFGMNMAQLAKTPQENMPQESAKEANTDQKPEQGDQQGRWAALRGYISATMEQNPAFANKS